MQNLDQCLDPQEKIRIIVSTIDDGLSSPAERMMLKLFLDNYKPEAIAYCAGVSSETVWEALDRGEALLRHKLGCNLESLRIICTRWKMGLR